MRTGGDIHEVVLGPGELYVAPRGVERLPVAEEETHRRMVEPASTAHTGQAASDRTVAAVDQPWL